jgi:hypothetical protein
MPGHLAPVRPGAREGLGGQLLGLVPVADGGQDGAVAGVTVAFVEGCEVLGSSVHGPFTLSSDDLFTRAAEGV